MIEFIKNMRSTERGKTLFKFILYMIFLVIAATIIFLGSSLNQRSVSNSKESNYSSHIQESTIKEEVKEELTYLEKQKKLYTFNYDFVYTINGDVNVVYEGTFKDGVVEGFKEESDTLIHYTIEDGIAYRHSFKEKQEFKELYQNLDAELFDLKNLFTTINQTSSTIIYKDSLKIYNYKELDDYIVEITTNKKEIKTISIKNSHLEYVFEFTY